MRSKMLLLSFLVCSSALCGDVHQIPHHVPNEQENDQGFADVSEEAMRGVVSITTTQIIKRSEMDKEDFPNNSIEDMFKGFGPGLRDFFRDFPRQQEAPRKIQGLGSGFIIKADKNSIYIATNAHVVADAKKVSVKFFIKKEVDGKIHAADPRTDLAVVVVPISKFSLEEQKKLRVLTWGDSEKVRVGHFALAIGTPFGLGNTLTQGVISAKGRDLLLPGNKTADLGEFFQHTAAINSGNSGGVLLNTKGQVIGINTVILTPNGGNVGVGFAICSNMSKNVIEQLIAKKQVKRGYIGISISKVPDDQRIHFGLQNEQEAYKVGQVTVNGPGDKSGVKPGDIITHFNEKPVLDNWRRLVSETAPGATVILTILRDEKGALKPVKIKIKVGEAPASISDVASTSKPFSVSGLSLSTVGVPGNENIKGLRVEKVDKSLQEEVDIRPKDIITAIRYLRAGMAVRQTVTSVDGFKKLIKAFKDAKQETVILEIVREDSSGSIVNLVTFPLDYEEEKKSSNNESLNDSEIEN
jgi:serine protease Do